MEEQEETYDPQFPKCAIPLKTNQVALERYEPHIPTLNVHTSLNTLTLKYRIRQRTPPRGEQEFVSVFFILRFMSFDMRRDEFDVLDCRTKEVDYRGCWSCWWESFEPEYLGDSLVFEK